MTIHQKGSSYTRGTAIRRTIVVTLFAAATAMAYVAVKPPSRSLSQQDNRQVWMKARQDRDELLGNKRTRPGPENDLGPLLAAAEDYTNRAYPAKEISFEAKMRAHTAFTQVRSRGPAMEAQAQGQAKAPAQWTLIGPSSANFPSILTFSGAAYTTSGRITGLAISPNCNETHCYLYLAAAGGGIWKTDKALSTDHNQKWDFISGSFGTNAIGTLIVDPTDPTGNTIYAGTGEPNASADSEAGIGLYKSTNGGVSWTLLPAVTTTTISGSYTGNAFANRAINSIVVDPTNPNVLYVGTASAVRGVASVLNGADSAPPVPLPGRGVYKSTDGGQTFTLLNGNPGLPFILRGVTDVALDPANNNTIYAGQFGQGVFRSTDGGASWTQIFAPVNPSNPSVIERDSIAVALRTNGHTRMYLGAGDNGTFASRFYRSDMVETGTPTFTDMTTAQTSGYCSGQCWYDNIVYSPPGKPNVVYLGGSYDYADFGFTNNGRAFLYSIDGGASFSDLTWDATKGKTPDGSCCQPNPTAPNGMHPDQHAIVEIPGTNAAFFGSDGGLTRSSGQFVNISSQCAARGLTGTNLAICQQLLSRVPKQLYTTYNDGLSTLQFQSLSINPFDSDNVQGGTQDNGTFQTHGNANVWPQIIYGDGGQSGFNAANPKFRFNSFTGQANDANFRNGDPAKWVIISAPIISSPEGSYFYAPIIADPNPANAGSIYQGSQSVWRTQDWGGNQAYLEANCPEFFTPSTQPGCGDFVQIGPSGATDLTSSSLGTRAGTFVAAIERAPSDTGTLWVATGTGRLFISKNADGAAASVTFTRLDDLPGAGNSPNRFISSIFVDPANPNHAWVSYSGYNVVTPTTPGHVFEVTFNPNKPNATWKNLDGGTGPMGDLPVTDLVRDNATGDLYASTDFGVLRLVRGHPVNAWSVAGSGLPMVEVAGLTIAPASRTLLAATHGRSAWKLQLP